MFSTSKGLSTIHIHIHARSVLSWHAGVWVIDSPSVLVSLDWLSRLLSMLLTALTVLAVLAVLCRRKGWVWT